MDERTLDLLRAAAPTSGVHFVAAQMEAEAYGYIAFRMQAPGVEVQAYGC